MVVLTIVKFALFFILHAEFVFFLERKAVTDRRHSKSSDKQLTN